MLLCVAHYSRPASPGNGRRRRVVVDPASIHTLSEDSSRCRCRRAAISTAARAPPVAQYCCGSTTCRSGLGRSRCYVARLCRQNIAIVMRKVAQSRMFLLICKSYTKFTVADLKGGGAVGAPTPIGALFVFKKPLFSV